MYVPDSFSVADQNVLDAFMQRYDFATLVNSTSAGLVATHIPVVVQREPTGLMITGHVARANPHWRALDGVAEALLIFQGPHAYVSPTWYSSGPAVPTWNYAVVHAYGPAQAVEDPAFVEGVLDALVRRYEAHRVAGWRMDDLPAQYRVQAASAIVGFRVPVSRLEAKFKLGQNRPAADRAGTVAGLERDDSADAVRLATFMRSYLKEG